MIYKELISLLPTVAAQPCIISGSSSATYQQLRVRADSLAARLGGFSGKRIATYLKDGPDLTAVLLALDDIGAEASLIGGEMPPVSALSFLNDFDLPLAITDKGELADKRFAHLDELPQAGRSAPPEPEGRVIIFTSGTSGRPKGVRHTWRSLSAGIKRDPKFAGSRWLLTYGMTRFAGLQVFLQAFLNTGALVVPETPAVEEAVDLVAKYKIENISGTPTFWRKLLTASSATTLRALPLRQITLGGETVTQPVLNALRSAFPEAQITHIYASTEMGVCFSVKDGLEGFPSGFLENSPAKGLEFKLTDGELWIRSNRAMQGYVGRESEQPDWFPSGDLVEVRGNRVFFLGRKSEIINVGGSKVYPLEVENEILKVPGVRAARVFGQKSSLAGQLVAAEVVAGPDLVRSDLRQAIVRHCNEKLTSYKCPRLINFVEKLQETDSQKIQRHQQTSA